jgi:PBSX family phage terminase large subunit
MNKYFNVEYPRAFLPKQIDVLKAVKKDRAVLYSGAFRAGKTLLLDHAAIQACLSNGGVEGMLVAQTETSLKSVVFDLFEQEALLYQDEINKTGADIQILKSVLRSAGKMEATFYNGSRIRFRSADEQRKLAGYTLDFFGMDEPVDIAEDVFLQLMGRISGTGNLENRFALLTTNPGSEMHWIYKYFYLKKLKGYVHVDTTTYDNVLLPQYDAYIKEKEQLWNEDWIRRYLNGKWGLFEGAIYKTFNPTKHVGNYSGTPIVRNIAGVDWGLRNPYAVLIIGETEDKRLIVRKEYYGNNMSSHELAKLIAKLHKTYKFRKVFCDPSAADLIMQTYELGVPIEKGDNDVDSGISKVNSIFKGNKCLVDEGCFNFIQEHQGYRYKQDTEKPMKENDHTCDAFRYGVTDYRPFYKPAMFSGSPWIRRNIRERWGKK